MNYTSYPCQSAYQFGIWFTSTCVLILLFLSPHDTLAMDVAGLTGRQGIVTNITGFLQGDLARGVIIMAIVVCGVTWFVNKQNSGGQVLGRIAVGAALILLAAPLIDLIVKPTSAGAVM